MSIRFKSLGSGSAGNATLIEAREGHSVSRLLVDCGMSARQLTVRLQQAGIEPEQLDGIFITHEHRDHIGCAPVFAARHRIPVWMSRGTHAAVGQPESLSALIRFARDEEPIDFGAMELQPFTVPHDVREPLQLVSIKAVCRGILDKPRMPDALTRGRNAAREAIARKAYFGPEHGWRTTPVMNRESLTGEPLPGPVIVEEYDTTTVVRPGWSVRRDPANNIVIQRDPA